MGNLKVITWARWDVPDTFHPEYNTVFTASILKPTWEYPIASSSMSIHKGRYKIFLRMSYQSLMQTFVIPEEYIARLATGNREAEEQANYIIKQQKAYHKMSDLKPGSHIIRTDTGEIIAEAERILRDSEPNST